MGFWLVTLTLKVLIWFDARLAAAGMKPEWKPVMLLCMAMGWQGWSKVDWVTVWLPEANWNCTISPTLTRMLLGENVRLPFRATVTMVVRWAALLYQRLLSFILTSVTGHPRPNSPSATYRMPRSQERQGRVL